MVPPDLLQDVMCATHLFVDLEEGVVGVSKAAAGQCSTGSGGIVADRRKPFYGSMYEPIQGNTRASLIGVLRCRRRLPVGVRHWTPR